ncbi:hypothetical protein MFLAVUS_005739 [Mucor flavus]|uniref:Uncharacterized protein n=1 Tax=Mucor flavus TaxID=439312 RepID=A0ABP9YZJ8_9FUNG
MSKLLFANKEVMDIVVSTVIGDHAKDFYYFSPMQQSAENIPDAIYLSRAKNLPPVIIGVRHIVDLENYLQLTSHGVSAALQYHTLPIIIMFVTSSITYEVKKRTTPYPSKRFLLQVRQCDPWARNCYFITSDSIQPNLTCNPLIKFVALSFFIIVSRCGLPAQNPHCRDPTMARLYAIMKQILEGEGTATRQIKEDLMYVCTESKKRLREAISALDESDLPQDSKKRVKDSIENAVRVFDAYQTKYQEPAPSPPSVEIDLIHEDVPASPAPESMEIPAHPYPGPAIDRLENWNYISSRLSELGENEKIPWNAIYVDGRRDGRFSTYSNYISLKSTYFRWKKNNQ